MLRQLHFARLDLALHSSFDPSAGGESVFDLDQRLAREVFPMPPLPEDRFLCAFSHIFAGAVPPAAASLPVLCVSRRCVRWRVRRLSLTLTSCRWLQCRVLQVRYFLVSLARGAYHCAHARLDMPTCAALSLEERRHQAASPVRLCSLLLSLDRNSESHECASHGLRPSDMLIYSRARPAATSLRKSSPPTRSRRSRTRAWTTTRPCAPPDAASATPSSPPAAAGRPVRSSKLSVAALRARRRCCAMRALRLPLHSLHMPLAYYRSEPRPSVRVQLYCTRRVGVQ